jgi:hypothetical protein
MLTKKALGSLQPVQFSDAARRLPLDANSITDSRFVTSVDPAMLAQAPREVKLTFDLRNADQTEIVHANVRSIMAKLERFPGDTGSPEVQGIAAVCAAAWVAVQRRRA